MSEPTIHGFKRGEWVLPRNDLYGPGRVLSLSEARMKRPQAPVDPRFVYVEHPNGSMGGWFPDSVRRVNADA